MATCIAYNGIEPRWNRQRPFINLVLSRIGRSGTMSRVKKTIDALRWAISVQRLSRRRIRPSMARTARQGSGFKLSDSVESDLKKPERRGKMLR
jgi:hypothetical protein